MIKLICDETIRQDVIALFDNSLHNEKIWQDYAEEDEEELKQFFEDAADCWYFNIVKDGIEADAALIDAPDSGEIYGNVIKDALEAIKEKYPSVDISGDICISDWSCFNYLFFYASAGNTKSVYFSNAAECDICEKIVDVTNVFFPSDVWDIFSEEEPRCICSPLCACKAVINASSSFDETDIEKKIHKTLETEPSAFLESEESVEEMLKVCAGDKLYDLIATKWEKLKEEKKNS